MNKPLFSGCAVAVATTFKPDTSVDYIAYEKLVAYLITNGADAIVACGTTGESATLSEQEQYEIVRCAVATSSGKVPVIAGAGSNSTEHAVALAKKAKEAGAQAVLTVSPYYNKPTQRGLVAHFSTQANAVPDMPFYLYNVAGRTACNIEPATCAELSKVDNIVGVKEASGNIVQVAEIAAACGSGFEMHSGNDDQVVPVLSLGGIGCISVLANIAPKFVHDMVSAYLNGDHSKAKDMQLKAMPLVRALFVETNPIPVKAALKLMGLDSGVYRLPLCEMSEANQEFLKREMESFGLI